MNKWDLLKTDIDRSLIEPEDIKFYDVVFKEYVRQEKEIQKKERLGLTGNGFVFNALEDFLEKYSKKTESNHEDIRRYTPKGRQDLSGGQVHPV